MDDQIKNAFQKVKQDIDSINNEINLLNNTLLGNNTKFLEIDKNIKEILTQIASLSIETEEKRTISNPADNFKEQTDLNIIPTNNMLFKPQKDEKIDFSTGNRGVPTDRQTNQQTNQQTEKRSFGDALELLNSLDNLKKEVRNKFKRITEQEFLVFSTLYQLEEEKGFTDYKTISQKLNLTESSIRDYIGKLIKKGIPVEKNKINNKMIQLSISPNLKKIATLSTILQLRNI